MRRPFGTRWRVLLPFVLLTVASLASAQAPIQTFYVPLPEQDILTALRVLSPALDRHHDPHHHRDHRRRRQYASSITTTGRTATRRNISSPVQATLRYGVTRTSRMARLRDAPRTVATPSTPATCSSSRTTVFADPRNPATILFDGRDKIGDDPSRGGHAGRPGPPLPATAARGRGGSHSYQRLGS